ERTRGRPVRRAHDRRLEPVRRRVWNTLLEERAPLGAVREALHQRRPPARSAHERLGDGEVVAHEVELRLAALGEEDLVRARDRDALPGDVDDLLVGHRAVPVRWRRNTVPPAKRCSSRSSRSTRAPLCCRPRLPPPTVRSPRAVAFSSRTASRSKSCSIRVPALETASSVLE